MIKNTPNYKKIYTDMIAKKYPDKADACSIILRRKKLRSLDIVLLNKIIVGFDESHIEINQKLKSYDKETVLEILMYQKRYQLNNKQVAHHFNISRNTLASWKKKYLKGFIQTLPDS